MLNNSTTAGVLILVPTSLLMIIVVAMQNKFLSFKGHIVERVINQNTKYFVFYAVCIQNCRTWFVFDFMQNFSDARVNEGFQGDCQTAGLSLFHTSNTLSLGPL